MMDGWGGSQNLLHQQCYAAAVRPRDLIHLKQVIFSTISMHNILDMLHGEIPETLLTYGTLLTYLCRSTEFSTKLRSFLGITFLLMILPTFFLNFPR